MRNDVKDFCVYHRLDDSIHPHQLRRSFARNIIRYSTTPILALKDHLKHWSLYMTDWYIGMDANLIEDLEAERLLLSVESMEKICTQTVGGNGGRRWTYELNRRIAEGRLPRTFRGKAGAEFRRKMIDSLHDSGSVVFPCGEFTSCVFQMDRALCTEGERPITNRCNPFDCANSYILPEHAPYYREKLTTLTLLFEKLNEAEKGGPVGSFYLLEMVKVRRVLKTFDE